MAFQFLPLARLSVKASGMKIATTKKPQTETSIGGQLTFTGTFSTLCIFNLNWQNAHIILYINSMAYNR